MSSGQRAAGGGEDDDSVYWRYPQAQREAKPVLERCLTICTGPRQPDPVYGVVRKQAFWSQKCQGTLVWGLL